MRPPAALLRLYAARLSAVAARGDADPAAAQQRTLARILRTYAGTELGRLQGFDRVRGSAEFRRTVRVSTPDTTRELFERVLADNPPDAVTPGKLGYMARCSGTSGVPKLVPYPPALIKAFKAFETAISMRHMQAAGRYDLLQGKLLITTGTPALAPAANGLRLGYGTGIMTDLAPRLFAGVIADVPFVDVLNTMLRDDLPLTPPEWLEWGNPIAEESAYARLAAYSPYDNVSPQYYPPILAVAGLTDPRVTYWEPLKWVQKLRATMSGGGPILLHTEMSFGHGGASGRFERLDEAALQYAFALACVGRAERA